ncbi:hypothetical protein BJ508DRAFT_306528 [Ascobolus immersus RN42]|uniref:Rhodopsin domain-containing protein n=1 Tax=Ascobolus immersus RN42 TaxID=1160509 RepID=A0A3N4IBH5_ASCIM|nr:hypothetical protein BJ508DRAFT_306528 [Ascobolus immersus RN42]
MAPSLDKSEYTAILHNTTLTKPPEPGVLLTDDKSHDVLVLHIVLPCVTLLFILLRNYSRFFFLRSPGWDDCLLNIAWIVNAMMEVVVCLQTKYGLGKHIGAVSIPDRMMMLKLTFIAQIIYFGASFLVKAALITFYFRISIQPVYKRVSLALMGLSIGVFLGSILGAVFLCAPVGFFWNRSLNNGDGKCGNIEHFFVANASLNMMCDIFTLILPMPIVWSSPTIPKPLKVRICALFLLGGVTCVASAMRISAMRDVAHIGGDVTWKAPQAYKWTSVELTCAIIAACMPAIKPLICTLLGKATPIEVECAKRRKRPFPFVEGTQSSAVSDTWPAGGNIHNKGPLGTMTTVRTGGSPFAPMTPASRGNTRDGEGVLLEKAIVVDVNGVRGVQKEPQWKFPPSSPSSDSIMTSQSTIAERRESEERYDSCYRPANGWAKRASGI